MFKAWNIADSLLTNMTSGHQFWEPTMIAGELRRRGKEVRLLGHKSIQAQDFPDAKTFPIFPRYYNDRVTEDPVWAPIENFIVHNRSIDEALLGVDRALFQNTVTLFPNVCERQLLGIYRWLERFSPTSRPKTVLVLSALRDWSAANPVLELLRKIWTGCPDALRYGVPICVRTDMSARKFQEVLGIRAHVLPSPLTPAQSEIEQAAAWNGSAAEPMTVAFLAGARPERGAMLLAEVVHSSVMPGVQFFVQLNDTFEIGLGVRALRALQERRNVKLHEGPLPRGDYLGRIAHSVVLLPYDRASYRWRSSGVYLEAKCLGAPVIVPSGTWMAEDVKNCGNGFVFENYNGPEIARCIAAAQADLPNLRARVGASAAEFRKQHGAGRFVDMVESLAAGKPPPA